jgi:hypothetical protein
MKAKQFILTLSTLVLAGSLMLTSCRKKNKEEEEPDSDQSTAQENQIAENMTNDIAGIGSQGSENGTLTTYKMDPSLDISGISSGTVTFGVKTFTVDFGPLPGVTCNDGRKRSGQLMFDYSISTNTIMPIFYRTPGFKMSIQSSNYTVDDYTVAIGSKTITNTTPMTIPTGTNPGTNLTWNITANITITKPASAGGGTITWSCNRTKTLVNTNDPLCYQGQGSPILWNKARVQIDGTASGTTASNESYTSVLSGLTRDFGTCGAFLKYPFIKGTIEFTPGTKATRYIDFGTGTCDRGATITIKGVTYSFNF